MCDVERASVKSASGLCKSPGLCFGKMGGRGFIPGNVRKAVCCVVFIISACDTPSTCHGATAPVLVGLQAFVACRPGGGGAKCVRLVERCIGSDTATQGIPLLLGSMGGRGRGSPWL